MMMSPAEFGALRVKISDMLTEEQKAELLLGCGASPSAAASASRGAASFFAHLEACDLFSRTNMNMQLWKKYPGVLALFQGTSPSATRPILEKNQRVEEDVMDPLAATLRQRQQQNLSTAAFLQDTTNHYRNAILTAMDETGAWKALLSKRSLLVGQQMEDWVAKLSRDWTETRSSNPSWQVLKSLMQNDRDFAQGSLEQLAASLAGIGIDATVASMVSFYGTRKDQQQAKSTEAFSAQNSLRSWLVRTDDNGPSVCDEGEADELVQKLRQEGVREPKDLRGMDKNDLNDMGFNKRQAITAGNKIKAEFK